MTFIASVIAKNGVAVIADSLVTASRPVLEFDSFMEYVKEKDSESSDNKVKLDVADIIKLFENKPSHTKDYEEKLFKFDDYTAITTAGGAIINDKRIGQLINELIDINQSNPLAYQQKSINERLNDLIDFFDKNVREHLEKKGSITYTTLILTHYNKSEKSTDIYKIIIKAASASDIENSEFQTVTYDKSLEWEKVVCDGQNKISESILYGDFFTIPRLTRDILPKIIKDLCSHLNCDQNKISIEFMQDLFNKYVVTDEIISDAKVLRLSGLSLQQAVDLAALLMRIEIDFQKYTQNIPTVGGVVKLAIIDKEGFKYISGEEINVPVNL